jgi:hypothetical protein
MHNKPMDLESIELHDAILDGFSIQYGKKLALIKLSYYQDPVNSKERTSAEILFSDVERINEVSDLLHLEQNRSAGNIVYWHPVEGEGTTYIYLVSGVIAITAKSVEFRVNA